MPVQFDDRTIDYIVKDAISGDKTLTGKTNPETWQLMKEGYVVLKNFIPKDIINMTMDTWKSMELDPKNNPLMEVKEVDIIHNSPKDSLGKSTGLYCSPFGVALHRWVWEKLKHHIDMDLQETYSYSRKYDRGAYLKAHADRPSCEISATICLDYCTDDNTPWTIWVDNSSDYVNNPFEIFEDTQGKPKRQQKTARKIDLEVGDILLYQGPNVIHWRDHFLGNFSYHMFLHFHAISSSKLNQLANKDTEFYWHTREMNNTTASQHITALTYDGRGSPFRQKGDPADIEHEEKFSEWMKLYEKCPNKSSFVNNYDDLEIKKK